MPTNHATSSPGFFGMLSILFIALKLTGCINWSWWWVLAPLWGPLVLLAFLFCLMACLYAIVNRTKP